MGLLWPSRSGQSVLLAGPKYSGEEYKENCPANRLCIYCSVVAGMDELEEFSQAPHVVNNCSISSSSRSTMPDAEGGNTGAATMTTSQTNGGNYRNSSSSNNSYSNQNGYTQKTIIGSGDVNLMDGSDGEDSEEIVINEFRRKHHQQPQQKIKVMVNGGGGDDDYYDDYANAEDDNEEEYEHISLSDDGLAKHSSKRVAGGEVVVDSSDISTDLLNCDDNDSDLLILTSCSNNINNHHISKDGLHGNDDSYRIFVNT